MAMQANTTAVERAFELAKSGRYVNVGEIKYRLHVEGHFADAITGTQLSEQLKAIIDTARKTRWHDGLHASEYSTASVPKSTIARTDTDGMTKGLRLSTRQTSAASRRRSVGTLTSDEKSPARISPAEPVR